MKVGAKDSTLEKITEENDMTENFEPHVETFVSEENLMSEPTEAFVDDQTFVNDLHPQNDIAAEEIYFHENSQVPVETYASHGGGSMLLRYVLLVTMVQSSAATGILTGGQCSLDDAPFEFSESDDMYLFLALGALLLWTIGFGLICLAMRKLKEQVASRRELHAQPRVSPAELQTENDRLQQQITELNARVNDKQAEIVRLRTELLASRALAIDQQAVIDDHAVTLAHERLQDRRSIFKAVGLLDRILEETHNLNQFNAYFAVTGRCWHARRECNGLNSANSVEERIACSFCMVNLPPYQVHPDTGTTFRQDCDEFFRQRGGRVQYMHTVIYDVDQ